MVCLAGFVFNLDLCKREREIERSFTNVLLRNVNKRSNPTELDLEEVILAMIVGELQLQSIIEGLIIAHYHRTDSIHDNTHRPSDQAEDKKAEECLVMLNRLRGGLESKLANAVANDRYGHLLTAAKFNIFLMELARITRL